MSSIKLMEELARSMPDVVSLSQGIPSAPSHSMIRASVIDSLLADKVDKYSSPQGILPLRKLLSQKLSDQKMRYTEEEIIITAGAIEAMSASMLALFQPGDEIIIPTPTYAAFFRCAAVAKLKVKQLPLQEEEGWQLDPEKLVKLITPQTKAILLCHPNNPTGSVLSREKLLELGKIAEAHNLTILLDEVYRQMYFGDDQFYSIAEEETLQERIVRIVSFSKDFSLTGWRVGFLHSSREKIEKILPVHDALINCTPVISQYAAMAALAHEEEIISHSLKEYLEHRELMGNALEKLSDYLSFRWPEGSYFFFPEIHGCEDSQALCIDILKKAGVAVVPGSDFGEGGEGHIRLCFGRDRDSITEGMKRLTTYFQTL